MDLSFYKDTVFKIIGASMNVRDELHNGLLEAVYQEALQIELKESYNIEAQREVDVPVFYKKHLLNKKYRIDLMVDDIIIELKSVSEIKKEHRAQLCNYLRLTHKPVGLLINFGSKQLYGERWIYDESINDCYKVDKNMQPIQD